MTGDETLNLLIAFVEHNSTSSSSWKDPDGGSHICDMGYVQEFLQEFKEYVISVGGMDEFVRLWKESK